jgi:thiol-disulfide isomerase/thioredoxin
MKHLVVILLLTANFSSLYSQKTAFVKNALSEKLMTVDSEQKSFKTILKKYRGKTVLIEIWASWCGDCVKAMPKMKALQSSYPNVSYIFISMDKTPEKWKEGIAKHAIVGDHYMANDQMKGVFGKAIDLDWIPRYIIIDKTGKIIVYKAIETEFEKINATLKEITN